MATKEAPKKDEVEEAVALPKKSKKLLIIIVSAVVVTLSLGAALGYAVGHRKAGAPAGAPMKKSQQRTSKMTRKRTTRRSRRCSWRWNLSRSICKPDNTTGEQFLQVVASLRVADEKKGEELRAFMPQIRHEILSLDGLEESLGDSSAGYREILADGIKDVVNDVLGYDPPKRARRKKKDTDEDDDAPVMSVFFTQFIVQ